MAVWALVENNQITELHDLLPKSWRHVSGLNLSQNDTEFLASLGWYKVVQQHQQYDPASFEVEGYDYVFEGGEVIESVRLKERDNVPTSPTEMATQQQQLEQENKINRRAALLAQSDWTQLADVQLLMSDEKKQQWATYRQSLRDLPLSWDNTVYIEWPQPPQD